MSLERVPHLWKPPRRSSDRAIPPRDWVAGPIPTDDAGGHPASNRRKARNVNTIVCGVDDSPGARAALRVAATLAEVMDARLVGVHVLDRLIGGIGSGADRRRHPLRRAAGRLCRRARRGRRRLRTARGRCTRGAGDADRPRSTQSRSLPHVPAVPLRRGAGGADDGPDCRRAAAAGGARAAAGEPPEGGSSVGAVTRRSEADVRVATEADLRRVGCRRRARQPGAAGRDPLGGTNRAHDQRLAWKTRASPLARGKQARLRRESRWLRSTRA